MNNEVVFQSVKFMAKLEKKKDFTRLLFPVYARRARVAERGVTWPAFSTDFKPIKTPWNEMKNVLQVKAEQMRRANGY